MPRKSPGGARDGFLTARVPERTKFGLKLMSRVYREPVPDLLIRALNNLYFSENGGLFVELPGQPAPKNLLELLWAERESDRAANMAFRFPALMSGPEARAWRAVLGNDRFWSTKNTQKSKSGDVPPRQEKDLLRDLLAEEWEAMLDEAALKD